MWIPILLVGGGLAFYFLSRPATPAVPTPTGLPAQATSLFSTIFGPPAPATPATPAKPGTPAAQAAAAAKPPVASGGPYFNAYWSEMNQAATDYNNGAITSDNYYAMEQGFWAQAQADYAAGNMSATDLNQLQTLLQHFGGII